MTQISRPQGGLRTTYPDSGAYTAVEWAERIRPFHSGDFHAEEVHSGDLEDSGVIPTNANFLTVTHDGADVTIDTGVACVHGHVLFNDAEVTISPTHPPGDPATYTVVAVQNDTADAYNTNLDTPAPYMAGVPAYSTRLAILQRDALVQNASYWMIPLATFSIDTEGEITNLADERLYTDTRFEVDSFEDDGMADVIHIGTHATTDAVGAAGLGATIKAWAVNAASTITSMGRLAFRLSDATGAEEESRLEIRLTSGGAENLSGVIDAPTAASADGNARGAGAVDLQQDRANDTEVASGDYSFVAGGRDNTASGVASHAEGDGTTASGVASHAEGLNTTADGDYSHAEGRNTTASSDYSHAEGRNTTASSDYSHAEGYDTTASGDYSHAEGASTTASSDYSHAEGYLTTASSDYSHAEGYDTTASSGSSHAEGYLTTASGYASHAEGDGTTASGYASHAEGLNTTASGIYSHAEGSSVIASGRRSHAEGDSTTADGDYSHAGGRRADTNSFDGVFIWADSENAAFTADRANQFKVRASGGTYLQQNDNAAAQPVLELNQTDQDETFINFVGTSAADQTKSISTANGDGDVTGPKNFSASAGWEYVGMVKVDVNGAAYWMPYYQPHTS